MHRSKLYNNKPIPTAATKTLPPIHLPIFPAIPVNWGGVGVTVLLPVNVTFPPLLVFVALCDATGGVVGVV